MSIRKIPKIRTDALRRGYRSGLEGKISDFLAENNCDAKYECMKIEWEDLSYRTYTPDFLLPNGIIIETKGRFTPEDRRKHLEIQKQHPYLDIRFVFSNSNSKLRKGSKTSYADWCRKHGFLYADKEIPLGWIKQRKRKLPAEFVKFPLKKIVR